MLKALILAGGRGARLMPLTDNLPKPMVEIKGKPFLLHQMEMLKKFGVSEILLCVGYLKDKVMDYFSDGKKLGLKIDYSIEDDFMGTAGGLKIAGPKITGDFILLYGDSYLPIDYTALIESWIRDKYKGTIVCYDNNKKIAKNNIYMDESRIIRRYNKREPDKDMNYVEAGVMVLKKDILDMIPSGRAVSLEEEIFPRLIKKGQLSGYPTSQRYYDIGTPKGLCETEEIIR